MKALSRLQTEALAALGQPGGFVRDAHAYSQMSIFDTEHGTKVALTVRTQTITSLRRRGLLARFSLLEATHFPNGLKLRSNACGFVWVLKDVA